MMYLRSVLWGWGILYLLINEYHIAYWLAFLISIFHHLYFKYSKKYILIVFILLFLSMVRVELRPYFLEIEPSTIYEGYVIEVKEYGAIVNLGNFRKCIIYNVEVDLGDHIRFQGDMSELDSLHNKGLFDYKTYMNQNGIYQSIQVNNYEIVKQSNTPSSLLYRYIQSSDISQLANQFLYGYSENTALDIFFSTGMHFTFFIYHLVKMCSFYFNEKQTRKIELVISFIMVICFPREFSLQRIFLFRVLNMTKLKGISKLSIGMGILLLVYPQYCTSLAFCIPFILSLSQYLIKHIPRFISNKLVLLPIQLVTQFEVNLLWLLFFDLFKLLFSFDFIIMFIALCIPPLSFLSNFIHSLIVTLFDYVSSINLGLIVGKASLTACILYLIGLNMVHESRKGWLFIVSSILYYFMTIYCSPFIKVSFIDVGQGDCMIVEYPFHQGIVMVDTGGGMRDSLASQVLVPYIKSQGYSALDVLIISHHDEDHDGAMQSLLELIPINHYVDYSNVPNSLIINDYVVQFLNCIRHEDDENNRSLISLFKLGDYFLLTAGDLSKENEEQLLREHPNLQVDFIKLSHHGSANSSSLYYLSRIQPKVAFNSSGRNNVYHHPSYEVLNTLKRLNIPLYDTQNRGSVHLYIFQSISFILSAIEP